MKRILSFLLALCMLCTLLPAGIFTTSVEAAEYAGVGTFEKYTGTLTDGYYLITYSDGAMKASVTSSRLDFTTVAPTNDTVTNPDENIVWYIDVEGTVATLYNESVGKYAASTGAKNKAQLLASGTDEKSQWTVSGDGTYEFVNVANEKANVNKNLRKNDTYGFACYATGTGGALTLYKLAEAAESEFVITPSVNNDAFGTAVLSGSSIVAEPAEGYEVVGYTVVSGTAEVTRDGNIFIVEASSDCEIQINFAARAEKTATFIANDIEYDSITNYAGEVITLPAYDGDVAKGYFFAGWAATTAKTETTDVEFAYAGKSYTLTDNVTFYALFARVEEGGSGNGYKFHTGALTTGDYIITHGGNLAMSNIANSNGNKLEETEIYPVGGVIRNPDSSIVWTITVTGETAAIYNAATNKYVQGATSGTDLSFPESTASWNIVYSEGVYDFQNPSVDTRFLRYNSSSNAGYFGNYTTSNGASLVLYKAANVTVYYTTDPTPVVEEEYVVEYIPTEGESVKYTTWAEALENATTGTLKLLTNLEIEEINLSNGLVLDLNGNILIVKTIDATVQDSLNGKGLIEADTAKLASVDDQLILWDSNTNASGYRVFDYTLEAKISDNKPAEVEDNRDGKTFWNVLRFTNPDAYSLVATGESGLDKVGFELDWNGTKRTYWFEVSVVADWGTAEKDNADKDYGFYIFVTGFDKLETNGTLTVKSLIQSAFDDAEKSITTSYQHTVG